MRLTNPGGWLRQAPLCKYARYDTQTRKLANAFEQTESWQTKGKSKENKAEIRCLRKNHDFGTDPEEKQKTFMRYAVRVGPFVKSL